MLLKQKEAYCFWLPIHRNFPRVERFGIGQKIEQSFIDMLEFTFASTYLPPKEKVLTLSQAIVKLDYLKFFMQLAWESKLIPTDKYSVISEKLEETGRMLGGWKKGLQTKTTQA